MNPNSLLTMTALGKEGTIHLLQEAFLFQKKYTDWQIGSQRGPVANLFFENSTRTHYSFAYAEATLGLKRADIEASASSVMKGESLYDTCKTLESIGYSLLVIRSPEDAYYEKLDSLSIPVINAGDGKGDHPTQCLLDLYTMLEHFGHLSGLKVCIVGDILHSRVAKSDFDALRMFGADVFFSGPAEFEREGFPFVDLDKAIEVSDVVMLLRIQRERLTIPMSLSDEEYHERFGLTKRRYEKMKENAIIMHPAPVNRGIEIDSDLVESPRSVIFRQMHNGVFVRKAAIKKALGFSRFPEDVSSLPWRF